MSDETKRVVAGLPPETPDTWVEHDLAEIAKMRDRLSKFGAFAPEHYMTTLRHINRLTARAEAAERQVAALRDLTEFDGLIDEIDSNMRAGKNYEAAEAALNILRMRRIKRQKLDAALEGRAP